MPNRSPTREGQVATRRRSRRVILSLPVTISTLDAAANASFSEDTTTLVVNLHGALILLAADVVKGQKLRIKNRATQEEQVCRVASFGPASSGKTQLGLEFLKPSPDFWQISFPPEDWVVPEPSSSSSLNE
jgi:hypothetical protein